MTRGELISRLRTRLGAVGLSEFQLEIDEAGVRLDDEWWFVPISPRRPETRAFDYAPKLNEVEEEFRADGTKLLLVPAINGN